MDGPWQAQGRTTVPAWLPRAVAWILPWCILLAGWVAVKRIPPPTDTELRDELIEAMAEAPGIVIVGNSITKAGIDPDKLGRALKTKVALLTVPGSEAPAWYAVVKNIVATGPVPPRLILIANRADGLITVSAHTEQDQLRLDQLMSAHEPVLVKKVLDRDADSVVWADFDRRRTKHRRAVLDTLRNVTARVVGQSPEAAVSAYNRVFADENLDYGLARNAWTPPDGTASGPSDPILVDPDESLIVDLAHTAQQHGIKVAFVHIPSAPGVPDLVTEDQMHDLVGLLNEWGVGYVARPRKPIRAAWFADPVHFRPIGRDFYTKFLAKRIQKLKLHLPNAPVPEAPLPLRPPTLTRSPDPEQSVLVPLTAQRGSCVAEGPTAPLGALFGLERSDTPVTPGILESRGLPPAWPVLIGDGSAEPFTWLRRPFQLRRACSPGSFAVVPRRLSVVLRDRRRHVAVSAVPDPTIRHPEEGSLTWVLPGTTLTVTATDAWEADQGPVAFQLLAHTFGSADAPRVQLEGAGPMPLVSHGGLWRGVLGGGPPQWTLRVSSPNDGPLVAIHSLTVGLGARRTPFLASGRNPDQVAFDIVGRTLADTQPDWTTPIPAIPPPVDLVWNPDGTGHFEVPNAIDLTDRLTGRCSPLAVFEEERPLERHTDCDDVRTDPGTQCHMGTQIRFHPSPGHGPSSRYTLAFDRTSGRGCSTALWLLPQDKVQVTANRQDLRRFYEGPQELHLTARQFGPPPSRIDVAHITLRRGPVGLLEASVRLEDLEHGWVVPLDGALPPRGEPLTIVLHNRSESQAVLFQKATLVEILPTPTRTARANP
ncbi:MAG: hypothetical protein AAGA48_30320 [Myxococcota bacterium]